MYFPEHQQKRSYIRTGKGGKGIHMQQTNSKPPRSEAGSIIRPGTEIIGAASVVGGREHEGPLGDRFDFYNPKDRFGEDTWEKAESEMQRMALAAAMHKAGVREEEVDLLFAGDLLNQCVGSSYGLEAYKIPYLGLYGACSTSAEGLLLASAMVGAGYASCAAAVTSSHNAAAERQFRTPLEYGGQRPQSGQWTVTGAGAFIITPACSKGGCPIYAPGVRPLARVSAALPGLVLDRGVTDPNNMGAAMAPAAESTLCRFFAASGTGPDDYDLIVTGDLGWEGSRILCDLMDTHGYDIRKKHNDCGMMIYTKNTQDTHSGGSGCGCGATVLASYLLPKLAAGEIHRLLFMATGALMSTDSVKQGLSIPGVAHLLCLETPGMQV